MNISLFTELNFKYSFYLFFNDWNDFLRIPLRPERSSFFNIKIYDELKIINEENNIEIIKSIIGLEIILLGNTIVTSEHNTTIKIGDKTSFLYFFNEKLICLRKNQSPINILTIPLVNILDPKTSTGDISNNNNSRAQIKSKQKDMLIHILYFFTSPVAVIEV